MNQTAKVAVLALLAFALPPLVYVGLRWDEFKSFGQVAPEEAEGYLLYFTAPG